MTTKALLIGFALASCPLVPIFPQIAWQRCLGSDASVLGIADPFNIGPNPFSDEIRVSSTTSTYELIITDILGRVVLQPRKISGDYRIETSLYRAVFTQFP